MRIRRRIISWMVLTWMLNCQLPVATQVEAQEPVNFFNRRRGFSDRVPTDAELGLGKKCANPDERIPTGLAAELRKVFWDFAPDTDIKLKEKTLTAEFRCQLYEVHFPTLDASGTSLAKEWIGPSSEGFRLQIHYLERQVGGKQGPPGSFNDRADYGNEKSEHYWKQRRYEFTLPNDRGYLWLDYSYGTKTDPKILSGIATAIETTYEFEKGKCQVFQPPYSVGRADDVVIEMETPLREFILKRFPTATVEVKNRELVVSHQVRDFKVHVVSPDGEISPTRHVKQGPLENGFLIKIYGEPPTVLREEVPVYGKVKEPYWTRIWNSISVNRQKENEKVGPTIRLEVNYGSSVQKSVLRDLEQFLEQFGSLGIRHF